MNKKLYLSIVIGLGLVACGADESKVALKPALNTSDERVIFSVIDAQKNLTFSKEQYLKIIDNIAKNQGLHFSEACLDNKNFCFPRSEEHNAIFMEKPTKWTNGFYPGLLWKLLSAKDYVDNFTAEQEAIIKSTALTYQAELISESKRGSTHDLGFILYDSFGEALNYDGLSKAERELYEQTLAVGRDTLSARFSPEKGVIKSWDWLPLYKTKYKEDGKEQSAAYGMATPWTYPVIVDNMMNLEFLFADTSGKYNDLAFQHAENTAENHYFYLDDDINKERPVSYHLVDYGNMKPGNWQGLGAISAWSRGQGWSLYGFITVVEAARNLDPSSGQTAKFEKHLDRLFNSVSHLLKDGYVPLWDFLATSEDAYTLASNQDEKNTVYSKILDLCLNEIPDETLPYVGYAPITLSTSLLEKEAITQLTKVTSINNEPFVDGDKFYPCGTHSYDLTDRKIPRDTSAAALIASGLYRLAMLTEEKTQREKYSLLADNIMAELTSGYLTSKKKDNVYDLGFVLAEATGNLPSSSEINTSIVYADFYFVEANIRKIALENKFQSH